MQHAPKAPHRDELATLEHRPVGAATRPRRSGPAVIVDAGPASVSVLETTVSLLAGAARCRGRYAGRRRGCVRTVCDRRLQGRRVLGSQLAAHEAAALPFERCDHRVDVLRRGRKTTAEELSGTSPRTSSKNALRSFGPDFSSATLPAKPPPTIPAANPGGPNTTPAAAPVSAPSTVLRPMNSCSSSASTYLPRARRAQRSGRAGGARRTRSPAPTGPLPSARTRPSTRARRPQGAQRSSARGQGQQTPSQPNPTRRLAPATSPESGDT